MADAAGDADPQALEVEAPGGGVIRRGLVAALVIGLDDAAGFAASISLMPCRASLPFSLSQ